MKKIVYLVLGLVAATSVFTGCNDEAFLEEHPMTIYTKENAFEKSAQVDAALIRAYRKFDQMFSYNNRFMGGGDAAANILFGDGSDVLGPTVGNRASTSFSNYWNLQTTDSNFETLWNSLYQLAAFTNLVYDGLDIIEGLSEDERAYLKAQADFFKGWTYLRLGEVFGGVPIQDRLSEELKFDYERASRTETYNYAIGLLEGALAGLPEYPKESGRLAKGIVRHFLAEAYLALGVESGNSAHYKTASDYATAVINAHPLMTERFGSRSENGTQPAGVPDNGVPRYNPDGNVFWDLFQIGNISYGDNGNTESLMVYEMASYDKIQAYGGARTYYSITIGPAFREAVWAEPWATQNKNAGASGGPWQRNIDQSVYPGGNFGLHTMASWGMLKAMKYMDDVVWEGEFADDLRNSEIVLWTPEVMDTKSPMYRQKVSRDMLLDQAFFARVSSKLTTWDLWGWNLEHCNGPTSPYMYQYGRHWYIARSAETYLLRAEAKLRMGDAQGAADDINALRSRSRAGKMFSAGEITLYTILDERARELSYEEHRWPTLLRMGKGGQDSKGENDVMKRQLENHAFATSDIPVFAGRTFPEWTLFPIPFTAIELNSEKPMSQNYGWSASDE